MKVFKRVWWLLTEAPTNLTELKAEDKRPCDYCGGTEGGLQKFSVSDCMVCQHCIKEALDKAFEVKS